MSHRRPPDSDEYEKITNEQVPHHGIERIKRVERPSMLRRVFGHRDEDRLLRRALLIVSLCIGVFSLTGSVWRAGSQINQLVTTIQRVGPAVDSLGKQVAALNTRMDSLTVHDARRERLDSARFAGLEQATAAVNRAARAVRDRP